MPKLFDLFYVHWFSIALLIAAAAFGLLAIRPKRRLLWSSLSAMTAAFAAGAIGLHGWTYRIQDTWPEFGVAITVLIAAAAVFLVVGTILLLARGWSFAFGCLCGFSMIAALGGLAGRGIGTAMLESVKSVWWTRFVSPWWLLLLAIVPLVYLISRKSLAGLGSTRSWMAIVLRSLVVVCLILALSEPRVRRPSENMTVMFVVDRSASIPRELEDTQTGDQIDRRWNRTRQVIEQSVKSRYGVNREDQFGVIFFGKRPKLAYPPSPVIPVPIEESSAGKLDENYTDIASAMKLALASFPESTGKRIVVVSDGNQNLGQAEDQADIAKKNGVPVDAIALAPNFKNENEVLVQSVEAPPTTAAGTRLPVRVLVRNSHPTKTVTGRLSLVRTGGADGDAIADRETVIELEPSQNVLDLTAKPPRVALKPGLNVFKFRDGDQARNEASYTYKAKFDPDEAIPGDRVANNRADAAVVARGQRKVLFVDSAIAEASSDHRTLLKLLRDAKIQTLFRCAATLPGDKTELGVFLSNFDCVVLANVPADAFSNDQMEVLRSQVYDQGCGLIMVGGPDSYGAGGYQETPVEAALPVDCEIKAKRAMGKGGLVLIMHASEMADGNYWQKVIAKEALNRLSAADMVGVVDFGFFGGQVVNWQVPFQEIGDKRGDMKASVDKMNPGDMPDFDPFLQAAADTLSDPAHELQVKHVILISDGDPNFSNAAALKQMAKNNITCTTIGVATHGVNEDKKMKQIAESTKDGKGKPGNFYKVTDPKKLPAIYIKESRKVSQSFIYDKTFEPIKRTVGGPMAGMPEALPKLHGFVRTMNKQSPTHEMHVEGPMDQESKQQFPVLSTWRYGLGKAVAFTSDGRDDSNGWSRDWSKGGVYTRFWENMVNWAMRETERGKLSVVTRYIDGKVKVVVEARDENEKAVPGLTLRGAVTPPNKLQPGEKPPNVTFKPNKNGQYEAEFDAQEAGAYFVNVQAEQEQLGPDGKPIRDAATKRVVMKSFDAARAGVTVPYSPEFVDLESNTALLKELAEKTGGQYFEEPNEQTNPAELARMAEFFRKGPEVIRSVLPMWFWLAFAAGLLLLADVAVRRISIETKEIRGWAARTWAALRRKDAPPDDEADGVLARLGQRKSKATADLDKKKRTAKFEADETPAGGEAPTSADDYAKKASGPPLIAPPSKEAKPTEDDDGDDFLSRMKKAKERGQRKQDGS